MLKSFTLSLVVLGSSLANAGSCLENYQAKVESLLKENQSLRTAQSISGLDSNGRDPLSNGLRAGAGIGTGLAVLGGIVTLLQANVDNSYSALDGNHPHYPNPEQAKQDLIWGGSITAGLALAAFGQSLWADNIDKSKETVTKTYQQNVQKIKSNSDRVIELSRAYYLGHELEHNTAGPTVNRLAQEIISENYQRSIVYEDVIKELLAYFDNEQCQPLSTNEIKMSITQVLVH